jgi:L-ascorbate metabolism protein UlaG (beta-lactamase superfamily)
MLLRNTQRLIKKLILSFIFMFLQCCSTVQQHNQAENFSTPWKNRPEIYYVGNMGIALVKNDSVVLIDALHDYYGSYYLPSDTSLLSKIQNRELPFSHLLAITATHIHGDHFDSTLFRKFSSLLPETKVLAGRQFEPFLKDIDKRVLSFADDFKIFRLANNLSIQIRRINHTGKKRHQGINNYRIEVAWDDFRLIHFGDAEVEDATFAEIESGAEVAIIPLWFYLDKKALESLAKAKFKKSIITHIEPSGFKPENGKLPPQFTLFQKYGDKWREE